MFQWCRDGSVCEARVGIGGVRSVVVRAVGGEVGNVKEPASEEETVLSSAAPGDEPERLVIWSREPVAEPDEP